MRRRIPGLPRGVAIAMLVAVNAVPAGVVVSRFLRKPAPANESQLAYGSDTPIATAAAKPVGIARIYMLAFPGEIERTKPRLRYLESLARRYSSENIRIAAVVPKYRAASFRSAFGVPDLPLVLDPTGALHAELHIGANHAHGGLALVTANGHLEFRSGTLLDDDDLRQLVEKYANGQIKYAVVNPGLASRFIVGERLPDWKVRSSIDDSPLSLRTITAGHDVALYRVGGMFYVPVTRSGGQHRTIDGRCASGWAKRSHCDERRDSSDHLACSRQGPFASSRHVRHKQA